ncbi:MAG: nucleoside hydrolase [Dongiaceae bacterium]
MPPPLIIDCDPGIDHAVSLLYAARRLAPIAVTTVHGNVALETATRNALAILALGGIDLPVAAGCAAPLVAAPRAASFVHGESGLDGAVLPAPSAAPLAQHAVDLLIEQAAAHRGALVVAALGPLTNLAVALRREPRLVDWIALVSAMAGSRGMGNMTPVAEFNVWSDPEAAAIVFGSGLRVRMIGYDLTRQIGFAEPELAVLERGGAAARAVAGLYRHFLARQRALWGLPVAPVHSPCAVVPLARPELVGYRPMPVAVELAGRHTRGMTVTDARGFVAPPGPPFETLPAGGRCEVAVAAEGPAIVAELLAALADDG